MKFECPIPENDDCKSECPYNEICPFDHLEDGRFDEFVAKCAEVA